MRMPRTPQDRDRVAAVRRDRLIGDVDGKYVLGNGVEQPVLVPEQPIDGRRLHAGRLSDGTGGDGGRALLAQESRRDLHEVLPRLAPVGVRPCVRHVATITHYCYRRLIDGNVFLISTIT